VAAEAGWRWLRKAPAGPIADRLGSALLIAFIVASAGGLGVAMGGGQPGDPLHYVYAVVALATVPMASWLARGRPPRVRAAVTFVAALIALVVWIRLLQTG
jgi:hypothetical protein